MLKKFFMGGAGACRTQIGGMGTSTETWGECEVKKKMEEILCGLTP